jgi:hypothetical protein
LACNEDVDCGNYPPATCGAQGMCVCIEETGSGEECNLPPDGLACNEDVDCGNYPPATCGAQGVCVCM